MWWPTLRLSSNWQSPPALHTEPNFGKEWISPLQPSPLCCSRACAHAYRYSVYLLICPGIGIARVHSFQFCRGSRWIIAAPKCLICSPGHGQISEPTNLIELSIPAGKGYGVATHTARAEWKGQRLSPPCNGLTKGILFCFVLFLFFLPLSIFLIVLTTA